MSEQTPSKKSLLRSLEPLWLLITLIAITVLHYENVSGSAPMHELSQRLYYLPIIYAAYRYGLRGGLTTSLVSAALYFPHIVQHWANKHSAINQHGGRVTADDAVGGGVVFQVWLPLNHSVEAIHAGSVA